MRSPLEITVELVTPAYAGAADVTKTDGIRPPTLKALLRFWWRTMYPGVEPEELFEREEQLFGSTNVGQGIRIVPAAPWKALTSDAAGREERSTIHTYMAYGAVSWDRARRASITRTSRLHAGQSVTFRIHLPMHATSSQESEILRAIWLLSAFGAFGSRARRGWGSLSVRCNGGLGSELPAIVTATNHSQLLEMLQGGLGVITGAKNLIPLPGKLSQPNHTAFGPKSIVVIGEMERGWEQAMKQVNTDFGDYRRELGAYRDHKPGEVGPDHNKRASWLTLLPHAGDAAPLGSIFGLPHNAQFSPPGTGPKIEVGVEPELTGRRASPLIIKVIKCSAGYAPIVCWLPAKFLPDHSHIYAKVRNGGPSGPLAAPVDTAALAFFHGTMAVPLPSLTWQGLIEPGSKGWKEVTW